jgi:hypothetical protein
MTILLYEKAQDILNNDIERNMKLCDKYKVRPMSIYWRCPTLESHDEWKERQIKRIIELGYWEGGVSINNYHCTYRITLNDTQTIQLQYQVSSNDFEKHIDEWYQGSTCVS